MDDKPADAISEDSLDRESQEAPPSEGADIIEFQLPKRGPGRPKGLGKVPGSGRKKKEPGEHDELRVALRRVALGQKRLISGPTGRQYWAAPSYSEQLRAQEILLSLPSSEVHDDIATKSEAELR